MIIEYEGISPIDGHHTYTEGDGLTHELMDVSDCSMMIGVEYLGVDINAESRRIYGISGYFSLNHIKKKAIMLPEKIEEGALFLNDMDLFRGVSFATDKCLEAKYDPKIKCLLMGEINCQARTIKICDDAFISILDGKIVAIYIMPLLCKKNKRRT